MKPITKKKKQHLYIVISCLMGALVLASMGVSTFAWFQANANVNVSATSDSEEITVSAPEGAKFYYFSGNGTPSTEGTAYYGYSNALSVIGKSNKTISDSNTVSTTFVSDGGSTPVSGEYFYEINKTNSSAINYAGKVFNLSHIRPGCYYSFCVVYSGNATLKATFAESVTGDNCTPKRRLCTVSNDVVTRLTTPISAGFALNVYTYIGSNLNAQEYIFNTLALDGHTGYSLTDGLNYASGTTTYNLRTNSSASTYIYFTFFMGKQDKSDALLYKQKAVVSSNECAYYQVSSSGDYHAYDDLVTTLSAIELI